MSSGAICRPVTVFSLPGIMPFQGMHDKMSDLLLKVCTAAHHIIMVCMGSCFSLQKAPVMKAHSLMEVVIRAGPARKGFAGPSTIDWSLDGFLLCWNYWEAAKGRRWRKVGTGSRKTDLVSGPLSSPMLLPPPPTISVMHFLMIDIYIGSIFWLLWITLQ